jgi:MFS family permease
MVAEKSVFSILGSALTRPIRLLFLHPIIIIASVNLAFDYGVLYIVLTSFAELWTKYYHLSVEMSGLHYLAVALGELAGSQIGAPMIDKFYLRKKAQHPDGDLAPEYRLPVIFPGALLAPVGLLIYGWTAEYRVHWIAVDIGVFVAMFGAQMSGMAWQAYIMDAYSDHTSSARAATQFSASLTAFLFPLFVPAMYNAMGYGWGNTAMAFASLVLAVPGPIVLWYWGAGLRARARSTY